MKSKHLLLTLLLALLVPWAAFGQGTLPIGTGTTYSSSGNSAGVGAGSPMGNTYYYYSAAQFIYTAEELGDAKTINSLAFNHNAYSFNANLNIYLFHTTASTVDPDRPVSDGTPVYTGSGIALGGSSAGWQTFTLNQNFEYNGIDNLLVVVCRTVSNYGYSSSQGWQYSTTTDNKFMVRSSDTNTYGDITNTSNSYTAYTNRPNVIIGYVPTTPYVTLDPISATVMTGFTQTLTATVGNVSGTPTINYSSSDQSVAKVEGSGTTATVTGIAPGTATITATMNYQGTDYTATCAITVEEPSYCSPTFSNPSDDYIKNFTTTGGVTNISNSSTYETGGYSDYYGTLSASIEAGETLSCTVTPSTTSYSYGHSIWVDWNKNYEFESDERVAYSTSVATGNWTGEIEVPATTAQGDYRMRVIHLYSSNVTNPCHSASYGEGEDYKLTVLLASCSKPSNLAVSEIGKRSAKLSWTENGEATAWQICLNGDEDLLIDANANPYTLTGLDPETDYTVKVRANCSSEPSNWTDEIPFTTEVACPAPTDLVISDITAYSANVNWSPSEGTFEFRYKPGVRPITNFDDSQMDNWTNIDADGDGYVWVLGSETAGVYYQDGVDVTGQGHNSSHDFIVSGSYSNYAGAPLTPDNYLVSPQITLGGSISFWAQAQDASYPYEHFGVAVSTTGNTNAADFTTIAEWTFGSRSANVLRSSNAPRGGNRDQSEWVQYTVDLSAYSGQGYVAIRHFGCTDQFLLNVDDIFIEEPDFELHWVYVTNPASPQALTNLEPETNYLVQVRANCGDEGYSAWLEGTFTTLPACMVPTNLVISNIDKRSADLAWIANGDETRWQICLNGDETNLITVSDTSYSFTNLTPETLYNVKVRAYCDEELQSAWSSPAVFTTLVACPAPTALAISDITNVSAVATWTYDGDVEFEYAEDVWKHYDNGIYSGCIGTRGTLYWGILLTPDMLPANQPLTHIAMYEDFNNANPTKISIYSGGDTAPGTFLYSEEVTPVGNGFHEIALAEPVEFDATQNLWIVCYNNADSYPAAGSDNLTNPNGRWVSLDGEEWEDINGYGYNYTWMIRAAFGNNAQTKWVAVNNPASPQTIAGLTPETNYLVRLRAVCGGEDGESVWVNTSFTTPAPTFTLDINGYGSELGNWYLISSPIGTVNPTAVTNMMNESYDLYAFDQAYPQEEWRNYKSSNFILEPGKGYLYANQDNVTLTFTGDSYSGDGEVTLAKDDNAYPDMLGWNLVGNPFGETAYIDRPFYVMNPQQRWEIIPATSNAIQPMQGVFVHAEEDGETMTFSTTAPDATPTLALNLCENSNVVDRAIVNFDGERSLPKFQINESSTKVYIPMEGQDYAVVNAGEMGEMPVNFKAEKNGNYTLSFSSEAVDFTYLHLIDNMTGDNTDLLANPSYTFNATTTDYASRFRLVFATGSSVDGDSFAFINGMGNLCIFGIEGEATVQVVDVLGHVLSSETFSGSYERKLDVAPSVYMIRLIQGNDVKVQKMVIR